MAQPSEPRIVAELGRPETPEETAARKAETSRKHRSNQTLLNLVGATIASLAIVLFLVVVVVRPAPGPTEPIDFVTIASQAQGESEVPLLAPGLPESWVANAARFESVAEVPTWYIGFITPEPQFIALNQGIDANATWVSTVLDGAKPTGETTIEGIRWAVYDRRDVDDPGNIAYALVTEADGSTIVLHGTADDAEFGLLATSIAADLESGR